VATKETDASTYALQKERDTLMEIKQWKELSAKKWTQELNAQEQREQKALGNDVKQQWSAFKKDHEAAFRTTFKQALEASFESLAKCFISWVVHNYTTGTLTMPKKYIALVESNEFDVLECQQEQIIFASGNLYIEYSVDRIIEELGDDITKCLHFEENEWQV